MQDVIIDAKNSVTKVQKRKQKKTIGSFLFSWVIKALIIGTILSIDLLLFNTGGSYELFADAGFVNLEVIYLITAIYLIALFLMFVVSFSSFLQNLLLATIFAYLSLAFMNQFATFAPHSILNNLIFPHQLFLYKSDTIIMLTIGLISFILLASNSKSNQFYFTGCLLVVMCTIVANEYIIRDIKKNSQVLYEEKITIEPNENNNHKKMVYISFEGFPSYNTIKDWDPKVAEIMLGFYAKNNFKLFPNAYVENFDWESNLVQSLNFVDSSKIAPHLLTDIAVDGYWNFNNVNNEAVFLKDNRLFEILKKAGYKINAFQTNGLNFCKAGNLFVVNKCVDMQTSSINIENLNLSTAQKVFLLAAQWLESMNINTNFEFIYGMLKPFVNLSDVPLIGRSYQDLYVVNSLQSLQEAFAEIEANKSHAAAYFIHINFPNNLYVYDEFCKVKPIKKWHNKVDYKWISKANVKTKREALGDQTLCLIGKLEELLSKNQNDNTVYIMQSVSGNFGLEDILQKSFVNNFKAEKLASFAIKDPLQKEFAIDYEICQANKLLQNYLFKRNLCNLDNLNLQENVKKDFVKKLLKPFNQKADPAKTKFDAWYTEYKKVNNFE